MSPRGSLSDFVRKSSCPCAAARPRRIEVAASSVQGSQRDASESRSLTKATRLRRPLRVKTGKTLGEQMFSAVHPTTDIAKILRHVRFVPNAEVGGPYSITSSARPSNESGTVILSAFAAFRLIIN